MELTDELLVEMNAYLSGQLDGAERRAFEARTRQDIDLQREVQLQHELRQGLSLLAQKERFKAMRTDLMQRGLLPPATNQSEKESSASQEGKIRPLYARQPVFWQNRGYLTAAASLALMIGIGWLFFWKQSIPAPDVQQRDKAFYSAFTPDLKSAPLPPTDPDLLGAAQPNRSGSRDSLQVRQGIGLLQRQQLQPAITQLQPIAQGLPGHWRASAQWYLALAYLKNGQPTQTDSLLTIITGSNGHPYQLEAQQLTHQLAHPSPSRP